MRSGIILVMHPCTADLVTKGLLLAERYSFNKTVVSYREKLFSMQVETMSDWGEGKGMIGTRPSFDNFMFLYGAEY